MREELRSYSRSVNRNHGFTLIELVIVLALVGILGVYATVRLGGTRGFSEFTYQDRLISALRTIQQRAMQDTRASQVFRLNISTSPPAFAPDVGGVMDFSVDYLATDGLDEIGDANVSLVTSDGGAVFSFVQFDNLGLPQTDSGSCASGCTVTFVGEQNAQLCIEPQGYIHEGVCG